MDGSAIARITDLLDRGIIDGACEESADMLKRVARQDGESSTTYGAALIPHAKAINARGEFLRARSLLETAVSLLADPDEGWAMTLAEAKLDLGIVCHLLDQATDAEKHIRGAMDMLKASGLSDAELTARGLQALGDVLESSEKLSEAETAYRQACDISERVLGREHATSIAARNAFAGFLLHVYETGEAEPIIRDTWHIAGRVLSESHPQYVTAALFMAQLLAEADDSEAAERLLRKCLALCRQFRGENSLEVADACLVLGCFLHSNGQGSEAEASIRQALSTYRCLLGEKHRFYAQALVIMGQLIEASHAYDRAWKMYLEAYEITRSVFGADHAACVRHLLRIADISRLIGSEQNALRSYNEAARIAGAAYGAMHPEYALCMERFSSMLLASGEIKSAIELLDHAERIRKAVHGEHHSAYLQCLAAKAEAHMASGDLHVAKILLNRVADAHRECHAKAEPLYAMVLLELGAIAVKEHRPERALSLLTEAMEIERRIAHHVFAVSSEATRQGMLLHMAMYPACILSLTAKHLLDNPAAMKSALNAVVRQKGIDGEIHLAQRAWRNAQASDHLSDRLRKLQILRRRLAGQLISARPHEATESLSDIGRLCEETEEMESELARSIPLAALVQQLNKADADTIVQHIPDDASLIEFACVPAIDLAHAFDVSGEAVGEDHYFAAVARHPRVGGIALVDLGSASHIDEVLTRFRADLDATENESRGIGVIRELSPGNLAVEGGALRKAIFDPLASAIGDSRHLIIAPDGELNLLSFGILPLGGEEYLIDRFVIEYVGSSRELIRLGEKGGRHASGVSVIVADPDFDCTDAEVSGDTDRDVLPRLVSKAVTRGDMQFPALPGTRVEGELVAKLLPDAVRLFGREATVSRITEFHCPRILHMATHGFFCPDQEPDGGPPPPNIFESRLRELAGVFDHLDLTRESEFLRSGLVLSGINLWARGGNPPPEMRAGILTALDILAAEFLGTELVVLSACNTGLGTVHHGEGVFGLRRAFALAGAKSLVMTLWRVDDRSAQEIMVAFYKSILEGRPKAIALRDAQLGLKARNPDPAVWGAFIYQGDPGPLHA